MDLSVDVLVCVRDSFLDKLLYKLSRATSFKMSGGRRR